MRNSNQCLARGDFKIQNMSSVERATNCHQSSEQATKPDIPNVVLTGPSQKVSVLLFSANTTLVHHARLSSQYRLSFKFGRNECKLVRALLLAHGFSEVNSRSPYFNLLWTGSHILPQHLLRHFQPYQKVNHFPRSSELTRKDKFYQNVRQMQHKKGLQHFNIIPKSFVLPEETSHFLSAFKKLGGVWIVKPVASSRGRGIFLVNHPKQVPTGEAVVVSHYIENPLCIGGLKFDARLYVAVTSVDPLCIYLYQEGLARFATVKYAGGNSDLSNQYMHLTNYSVNKDNPEYIRCSDPGLEDFGNKWSFSALLRHLQKEGVDITSLMMRIEDVIIKAILSAEPQISAACLLLQPYSRNCFELYGFDILIDKNLQPWVLEVNLSPSLACDTPLDLKIKSNLVADLLSLIGITAHDPCTGQLHAHTKFKAGSKKQKLSHGVLKDLTPEKASMLRTAMEENARRGGFLRIFPSEDTWEVYGSFLGGRNPSNHSLHRLLYPERIKACLQPPPEFNAVITQRLSEAFFPDQNVSDAPNAVQRACSYTAPCLAQPPNHDTFPVHASVKTGDHSGSTSDHTPGNHAPRNSDRVAAVVSTFENLPGTSDNIAATNAATNHTPILGTLAQQTETSFHKKIARLTEAAGHLSKYKVRQLFACYLSHVQKRLIEEQDRYDKDMKFQDNKDIDMVVQFLMTASRNMKTLTDIFIPHHSLPLRDRRKMLGKQLMQFIAVFRKETAEYKNTDEPSSCPLSPGEFKAFLLEAREADLEELLEAYAKRSATSIFCNMPPSLGTQLSGEVSDLPTQPKPDVFGCADEKSQLHESPGDHLGSCNGSRPECETFQPDVAPRKSQQHLEGSVEDSASRMEKLTVYTKPRLPSVSTHSLPAASSSTAMASVPTPKVTHVPKGNSSRQASHQRLKWLPFQDRRPHSAGRGMRSQSDVVINGYTSPYAQPVNIAAGSREQKPSLKKAATLVPRPPPSPPVSKATTLVPRPPPNPPLCNKTTHRSVRRCLSAHCQSTSPACGSNKLGTSQSSPVLDNRLHLGWYSGEPDLSNKRAHEGYGHSSLQKKVDSDASISMETLDSGPDHIDKGNYTYDQIRCKQAQVKEDRLSSQATQAVEIINSDSNPTNKGKYEQGGCLLSLQKKESSLMVMSVKHQLKLQAHSEAIAKHLLKKLVLIRAHKDPMHL